MARTQQTLAEVIWACYDHVAQVPVPVPSWADLEYLGAIPSAIIAVLCHPAVRRKGRRQPRSTLGRLVALGHPLGDVVIVFFTLTAVRRMTGHDPVPAGSEPAVAPLVISFLAPFLPALVVPRPRTPEPAGFRGRLGRREPRGDMVARAVPHRLRLPEGLVNGDSVR